MNQPTTVHVTVELPTWVYRTLRAASKRAGVHPAVYISHLLKVVAFLTPKELAGARRRLVRVAQIRQLWLDHHSQAEIVRRTGVHKNAVSLIVQKLNREDAAA